MIHEAHLTERFGINSPEMQGVVRAAGILAVLQPPGLTTEYRGHPGNRQGKAGGRRGRLSRLLGQGVRANLKQLFEHGLFHADPIPATCWCDPRTAPWSFLTLA
jgi:hypothetical protein